MKIPQIHPSVLTGKTPIGDPFHERRINGVQILAQRNRRGEWHGYVSGMHKTMFASEKEGFDWVLNYPMSECS